SPADLGSVKASTNVKAIRVPSGIEDSWLLIITSRPRQMALLEWLGAIFARTCELVLRLKPVANMVDEPVSSHRLAYRF
ncbi:15824_t:CDS:1, partial [Acaulospora colombiana]